MSEVNNKGEIMPVYVYNCPKCKNTFERLVDKSDKVRCPDCGGKAIKTIAPVARPVIH